MTKYLLIFFFPLLLSAQSTFFFALGKVESNNNDLAIGDSSRAISRYQIWHVYYLDAKEFDKSINFSYSSLTNQNNAEKVMLAYFRRYESTALKNKDWETLARLHNGGPNWRKKKDKTDFYWKKVKKELDVMIISGKVGA